MVEFLLNSGNIVLLFSIILIVAIFAAKSGARFGTPTLLLFLVIGMLFGSDGLGVQFNSSHTAQFIGMLALSVILFSGGMDTKYAEIKPILAQGVVLATAGGFLTAMLTGFFIYFISGVFAVSLSLPESFLLAAVMSSTDSASVFSILRSKKQGLKQNLRPLLELESGSNDPMAYILTIILVQAVSQGGDIDVWRSLLTFVSARPADGVCAQPDQPQQQVALFGAAARAGLPRVLAHRPDTRQRLPCRLPCGTGGRQP